MTTTTTTENKTKTKKKNHHDYPPRDRHCYRSLPLPMIARLTPGPSQGP